MKRDHSSEEKVDVGTGTTRSVLDVDYSQIPIEGIRAVGQRFALGAVKHGVGNWKLGQPWRVVWNHMMHHMFILKARLEAGERFDEHTQDDDIGAIIWGGMAMAYYERSPKVSLRLREVFYGTPEPFPPGTDV